MNEITAERIVTAFQPSLMSGSPAVMDAEDYKVVVKVVSFLVMVYDKDLLSFLQ